MQIEISIEPKELDASNQVISEFSEFISETGMNQVKNMDGIEVIKFLLNFVDRDVAILFLGVLLGQGIRISIVKDGISVYIKTPKHLAKVIKALKSDVNDVKQIDERNSKK